MRDDYRFDYQSDYLHFSVREPFASKISAAEMVFGRIDKGECLEIISQMPQNGVIFSDGIENDFLKFDSGSIAKIEVAERKVNLVVGEGEAESPPPISRDTSSVSKRSRRRTQHD